MNNKTVNIDTEKELENLILKIDSGVLFADSFKFMDRYLFLKLLKHLNIDCERFVEHYYFYDKARNLHISESEFGYIWISTYGLIAREKSTDNNYVNAFLNQSTVFDLSPKIQSMTRMRFPVILTKRRS